MLYLDAKPNAAHLKLAQLERAGKLRAVITQNIDGLHQKAGSQNVLGTPRQRPHATTASGAGSSIRPRISSAPPVCHGVPAAAPSSRTWTLGGGPGSEHPGSGRWPPSIRRRSSSSGGPPWWCIRQRGWSLLPGQQVGGHQQDAAARGRGGPHPLPAHRRGDGPNLRGRSRWRHL